MLPIAVTASPCRGVARLGQGGPGRGGQVICPDGAEHGACAFTADDDQLAVDDRRAAVTDRTRHGPQLGPPAAVRVEALHRRGIGGDLQPAPADGAGGTAGPGGDSYLYTHLQVDAQANVRVGSGLSVIVYGLNLTNEVFGFYNGSPQDVVQREFYKPTFAFGVRWVPSLK